MAKGADLLVSKDKKTASSNTEAYSKEQEAAGAVLKDDMTLEEKTGVSYRLMTLLGRDIRTQLHSILGLTEIYMDGDVSDRNQIGELYGKMLMSESQIMDILDDTLEIGNLMRGDEEPGRDLVSIFEILANLEDDLSNRLALKGITLSVETEEIGHTEALVDEQLFYGVLLRMSRFLVRNMAEGGMLMIAMKEEEEEGDSFKTVISFQADPCAIGLEQMKQMLRHYDKISGEIQRKRDEIDLGLVVVKRYLKALGGTISCEESEEGKLTLTINVSMSVPAFGEERQVSHRGREKVVPDLSGMKALIVDDDMINLEVGVRLLQNTGLEVSGASSGKEGLQIYEDAQGAFDVVLLDIRMPGLNGLDLARRIRTSSVPGGSKVPIIAMSANATEEDIDLSHEAGIDLHMIKPIESWRLYGALTDYLKK